MEEGLIAVFTSHAILDPLALVKITLRIVTESGPYRKWEFFLKKKFSLTYSFGINLIISLLKCPPLPLIPLLWSMMTRGSKKRDRKERKKADEITRRVIGIQLLASLEILKFRYTILVLNRNSLHAVLKRIKWAPGNLVKVA